VQKWPVVKQKNIKKEPRICDLFVFELDDECKIINNNYKTLVTKEICSWLPALHKQTTSPSCPSNQCGSQEHISLITDVLFLMNLHSSTNSNTNSTNA